MNEIRSYIERIAKGEKFQVSDAGRIFQIIMAGGATPAQVAAVLMGLKLRGETPEELTGAVLAVRNKMHKLDVPANIHDKMVDTCGTGGDGKNTLNISTAVSFVVAASGLYVAKHGNRAVSSNSGSADVLKALGVNIETDDATTLACLEEAGMCFMLAPRFHPAMRDVAPVRLELGMRTIFNIIGPLANPASPKMQLVGVYSRELMEPVVTVLKEIGVKHAWVVHGSDGMDEITLEGPTFVTELKDGNIRNLSLDPTALGIEKPETMEGLEGGDAVQNAQALGKLLKAEPGPYRDIVLLNAAATLVVGNRAVNLHEGIKLAADSIDSGRAKKVLEKLVEVSNRMVSR